METNAKQAVRPGVAGTTLDAYQGTSEAGLPDPVGSTRKSHRGRAPFEGDLATVRSIRSAAGEPVSADQPIYRLSSGQQKALHGLQIKCLARVAPLDESAVLSRLGELQPQGEASLTTKYEDGVLDLDDLKAVLGYVDFARALGLPTKSFSVRVSVEGDRAYVLTPTKQTLLGDIGARSLFFTLPATDARSMLHENTSGSFHMGDATARPSRFATVADLGQLTDQQEVVAGLGLQGYARSRVPLEIVQVTPALLERYGVEPMVPLVYKMQSEDGSWQKRANFGDGAPRGFTSGGFSEVVFPAFDVRAPNPSALSDLGISTRTILFPNAA